MYSSELGVNLCAIDLLKEEKYGSSSVRHWLLLCARKAVALHTSRSNIILPLITDYELLCQLDLMMTTLHTNQAGDVHIRIF